jgi:hypothetical protein
MQPDCKPRQPPRQLHGRRRRRGADHQACRGEDALDMRALNGLIDLVGEAEIVRRDDQIFQLSGLVPLA